MNTDKLVLAFFPISYLLTIYFIFCGLSWSLPNFSCSSFFSIFKKTIEDSKSFMIKRGAM